MNKVDNMHQAVEQLLNEHQAMVSLLQALHGIALRRGADTAWERVVKSMADLGISPISARHYFADGTDTVVKTKHLHDLLVHVGPATGLNATLEQSLRYVHNTNGGASYSDFIDDHDPIGKSIWRQLCDRSCVYEDASGKIRLTEIGNSEMARLMK